ncbi:unnamed protein product, partial [Staurois parvus]
GAVNLKAPKSIGWDGGFSLVSRFFRSSAGCVCPGAHTRYKADMSIAQRWWRNSSCYCYKPEYRVLSGELEAPGGDYNPCEGDSRPKDWESLASYKSLGDQNWE